MMRHKYATAFVQPDPVELSKFCDRASETDGWEVVSVTTGQVQQGGAVIQSPSQAQAQPFGVFIVLMRMPFAQYRAMMARREAAEQKAARQAMLNSLNNVTSDAYICPPSGQERDSAN